MESGSDGFESPAHRHSWSRAADEVRKEYLNGRRNVVLSLSEIRHVGEVFFGDPEGIRLYGRNPTAWFAAGARVLGRTCVEASLDERSRRIAESVRACVGTSGSAHVVDLFAGSGNLAFHIAEALGATALGIECDEDVYRLTRSNLDALGIDLLELRLGDWTDYSACPPRAAEVTVYVVAPPWGDALSCAHSLDLLRTTPSTGEVLAALSGDDTGGRRYAVVQVPFRGTVEEASLRRLCNQEHLLARVPGCLIFDLGKPRTRRF